MAAVAREDGVLELYDAIRPGPCPICGRPLRTRRYALDTVILSCSARCGWWTEVRRGAVADVPRPRRPVLQSLRGGRDLPRLF